MFKQTLLAVAIGTLVGFASPEAMAETATTPAQNQQIHDILNAGRLEAYEKAAQTAKETGDERRATFYEGLAQHAREPTKPGAEAAAPAQATTGAPVSPEKAALLAEAFSVGVRGAADAMQAKANEPGAEAFLKESAAEMTKAADTAEQDAATAHAAAEEAAAKEQAEAAPAAEPAAAEPVAETTPEQAAEPVAEAAHEQSAEPVAEAAPEQAAEPVAEAAPEPAAESSGGEY